MSSLSVFCLLAFCGAAVLCEETVIPAEPDSDFHEQFSEWEGRIVGGRDAFPGQFPHQVAFRLTNDVHFCGGAIIHQYFIISAAHCFQKYTSVPANIRAVVGAHRRSQDGIIHLVAGILNHRGYDRSIWANDIAIVRTIRPIQYNSVNVRAINLPTRAVPDNFPLAVSGWGILRYDPRPGATQPVPDVLQYKITTSLNHETCIYRLGRHGAFVHENSICTSNPLNRGSCLGDSGGPLMGQDGILYGIVSWGIPCGRARPDVYASVFHHLSWIQSAIRN